MILVTGGAGFIGANFVLDWLDQRDEPVVVVDKLTYAGNAETLGPLQGDARFAFELADICDRPAVDRILQQHRPRAILHFAAESHVDRSIDSPAPFMQTNILGTFTLLEAARAYWPNLPAAERGQFRFLHVSTDEVYGSLTPDAAAFSEVTPYAPNSPYAASKAASDHLVRAYHHTYGVPLITTNCSNNYGPYQFPEKLIPLVVTRALAGEALPIYGDGQQIRDWLYVGDHCTALRAVLDSSAVGECWNIGGCNEKTNLEVVETICAILDTLRPLPAGTYRSQIAYVTDRPGHDRRYAIDARKIERDLQWTPSQTFESGLQKTVEWYLDHPEWVQHVHSGEYRHWLKRQYG